MLGRAGAVVAALDPRTDPVSIGTGTKLGGAEGVWEAERGANTPDEMDGCGVPDGVTENEGEGSMDMLELSDGEAGMEELGVLLPVEVGEVEGEEGGVGEGLPVIATPSAPVIGAVIPLPSVDASLALLAGVGVGVDVALTCRAAPPKMSSTSGEGVLVQEGESVAEGDCEAVDESEAGTVADGDREGLCDLEGDTEPEADRARGVWELVALPTPVPICDPPPILAAGAAVTAARAVLLLVETAALRGEVVAMIGALLLGEAAIRFMPLLA